MSFYLLILFPDFGRLLFLFLSDDTHVFIFILLLASRKVHGGQGGEGGGGGRGRGGVTRTAKLNLVDLAGSERWDTSGADEDRHMRRGKFLILDDYYFYSYATTLTIYFYICFFWLELFLNRADTN